MDSDKRYLVIVAHPDDEILGCGGSIARHIQEGKQVFILILGEGITSRGRTRDQADRKEIDKLHSATSCASRFLGVSEVIIKDFPDNRFDSVDLLDIVKVIEDVKEEVRPDVVYTHHYYDLNIDHRITYDAVMTAFRPLPHSNSHLLCTFETPSSTNWCGTAPHMAFIPNYYIDISTTIDRKIEALKKYKDEMREFPHARSIVSVRNLALQRGSEVGLKAAEAFSIVRMIYS